MATELAEIEIDERINDLLDEAELDRRLKISLAQADRGEFVDSEEMKSEILWKIRSGFYAK